MLNFKIQKDRRGLSLVELICAVAILAIITATIGGAMAVASNSYRQGTVEASLQQEAQFTANLIESLIIDVTTEVNWDAANGKLEIINDDGSYYEIVYADGKLTYTEYGPGGVLVGSANELLADHVSSFNVFGAGEEFKESRNIRLSIEMENGKSKYTTSYNVTSRNNPNEITALTASATILCEDEVILEPNEDYDLAVTISGVGSVPSYSISGNTSTATKVVAQDGGAKISIGNDEKGGHLVVRIEADAADPKNVNVYVRRVNDLTVSLVSLEGEAGKKDAKYTVKVDYDVTYPDRFIGLMRDLDSYVNPRTVCWSICSGSESIVSLTSDSATRHSDQITFTLKEDLGPGTYYAVEALALHPEGVEGATDTNRTGIKYDTVKVPFVISVSDVNSADFARGKLSYVYPNGEKSVEDWIFDETGNVTTNIQTMKLFMRFRTIDGLDRHVSTGYDNDMWYEGGDGGGKNGNAMFFKFRSGDLVSSPNQTYYMRDYEIQILFGVYYQIGNTNNYTWYPEELNDIAGYGGDGRPNQSLGSTIQFVPSADQKGVFTYRLAPMSIEFVSAEAVKRVISWWPYEAEVDSLDLSPYKRASGDGLGSASNPIVISKSSPYNFKIEFVGATAGTRSLFNNAKVYNLSNASDIKSGIVRYEPNSQYNADTAEWINDGTMSFDVNNLSKGVVYKAVLDQFDGYGTEYYSSGSGVEGKGEVYFTVVD